MLRDCEDYTIGALKRNAPRFLNLHLKLLLKRQSTLKSFCKREGLSEASISSLSYLAL